ncbi:MAG: FAD/NAD(P)-binding protein, partial [Candidatus Thermoplasmatota archaeon]|nr:FAD/NAD(P)-binding protein [Candidatus Thermoplasmatota archaeon]
MARVVIVGAGIAGLSAAIHAVLSGHHVVVLEKRNKIGGRGTSQNVDGFSLHYGPHLFDKSGPFFQMCKKLSRVKPEVKSLRLDKVEVAGFGPIRPVGNVKQAVLNKRSIKRRDPENPYYKAIEFLSSWGIEQGHNRIKSVTKS